MPRILFVKTSSLGDIVHNCPAVSDVARHVPDAAIDWVVEESFAEVAELHACVRRVIRIALRRWRRAPLAPGTWSEARAFGEALRAERYDVIVDSQGLLKSALVAALARGRRHGPDRASAREPLAARFYDVAHAVPAVLHAIERNRRLAGAALGYVPGPDWHFGLRIDADASPGPRLPASSEYALLLTMTSRNDKLWPEERWRFLGGWLLERGIACALPWGSDEERSRCQRIAAAIPGALVPQRMSLAGLARLARGARVAVGVDTGLTHLAAALGIPAVGLYCASSPALTGLRGGDRALNLGDAANPPEVTEVQAALAGLLGRP